jgi:pSer/pThr/pTyr-binding forkhead associated (FHA) protein
MELKLIVVDGKQAGMEVAIPGPLYLIGRGSDCQLRPQSHLVSRKHCAITLEPGAAAIEDCGSTNGTFVNGERIQQRRELKNGDRIKVGVLTFDVHMTVSVSGKMKPKVHNVQEAATRVVATTPVADDEPDVSDWLEDEDEEDDSSALPKSLQDTMQGKSVLDTVHLPVDRTQPGKDTTSASKSGSHAGRAAKPVVGNSQSAAEDALRRMISKKKP